MRFSLKILTLALMSLPLVAHAYYKGPSRGARELERGAESMVRQDYAGALPQLQRAVKDKANDPIAHLNLAWALRASGRFDEAIPEYQAALRLLGPRTDETWTGDALYGLALSQEGKGDHAAAAQAWRDYMAFAKRFPDRERGGLAVAPMHLDGEMRAAGEPPPYPMGPQRASIPRTTR